MSFVLSGSLTPNPPNVETAARLRRSPKEVSFFVRPEDVGVGELVKSIRAMTQHEMNPR